MRSIFGRRFQRNRERALDIGIAHFARRTRARFIQQSVEPPRHKTLPPFAYGLNPDLR
jgi:hypothetical protein